MNISKLSSIICQWLNHINPKPADEYEVIEYGMELFLENVLKLCFILITGFVIGKAKETLVILFTFCTFRLQAGGWHATKNITCTLSMFLVWGLSLIASHYINIGIPPLVLIAVICTAVIIVRVPQSINIKYFTPDTIIRKKIYSFIFLCSSMIISVFCSNLRMLIAFPIILETLTLIPTNKVLESEEC